MDRKVNTFIAQAVRSTIEQLLGLKIGVGIVNVDADGVETAAIIIRGCKWITKAGDPIGELVYGEGFDDSNIFGGS